LCSIYAYYYNSRFAFVLFTRFHYLYWMEWSRAGLRRSVGFFFLMNSQKVCTAGRGGGNVTLYSRGCRMHAAAPPPPTTTSIKLGDRAAAVAASADLFSNQWMGRARVVRIVAVVVAALVRLFQTCMVARINWSSDEKTTLILFRDGKKSRFPETRKILLLPQTLARGHFRYKIS